jgi:hypothetical protein
MQLLIAIELVLILAAKIKVNIDKIERDLRRKPVRYDDTDTD